MKLSLELTLSPPVAYDHDHLQEAVFKKAGINRSHDFQLVVRRRSIDARSAKVKVNLAVDLYVDEKPPGLLQNLPAYHPVNNAAPIIIVGMGPAGMFAALKLIELGIKPIIIERGKDVRTRRRDLVAINKHHIVNPDSNYCFGEGGAGTYSDGKLYTRSKKRGDVRRILEILVAHGAPENILIDAHPHIGTNKLPKVVAALRETIGSHGGEIHFNTRVNDLIIKQHEIKGVVTHSGNKVRGQAVILATGHSARDIYELLSRQNILLESKNFALGVRIEHAQRLIDQIQYHCHDRGPYLPAASYGLTHQVGISNDTKRGVFSFCMCPGGFIVPSATAPGEIVVNGMSPSRRDSRFANSGMVVEVKQSDLIPFQSFGPMAGLHFQKSVEQKAFALAGGSQAAPAQRLMDFLSGKVSIQLNETSYQPGLTSVPLDAVLPDFISSALKSAFHAFGKKMKGYLTNEAQLIGVESRTSSPVTIPRQRDTGEHPQIARLFPCGEGAGFAGGIISAAMDGEFCAFNAVRLYGKKYKSKT